MDSEQTPSDLIAERVKALRKMRGMTVRQLAARCAEAGMPQLTEQALYKLEGQRGGKGDRRPRPVSVDELLILAHVLDVPPVKLIVDVSKTDVELLPGIHMDPWDALLWIGGANDPQVHLVRLHENHVYQWQQEPIRLGISDIPRPAGLGLGAMAKELERSRGYTERALIKIRSDLRKDGVRPPVLPPELQHIDAMEP